METPHILIIEDHKDFREALRYFLELNKIRARIIEASCGEEGVILARKKKPQIVIMDFALKGIDGLEAARRIKEYLPQCAIIMLTVYDPKEIFRRDGHGAIRFFINKDDLYDQLMPVICRILGSRINKKITIKQGGEHASRTMEIKRNRTGCLSGHGRLPKRNEPLV